MSDDPAPCSNCSKPKHQFEPSENASRANWVISVGKIPLVKQEKIVDKIYSSKFIKEICSNPGCNEGQELIEDLLDDIDEGIGNGWDQIDKGDIELLEQFSEGALDRVDENGIEWQDGETKEYWGGIEDKIDELDESFTEQAPKDIALWGVENVPSPGKKKIPRIAETLSNLHESRVEIKRQRIQEQIGEIATYEEWEKKGDVSHTEAVTDTLEQAKGNVRELNEVRERLGTYRDHPEFDPLEDLSEDKNKSWQEQKAELKSEHEQLQQLREIEEQRQSNVDGEWYDEQLKNRKTLLKERMTSDVGKYSEENDAVAEDVTEERAATEKEEKENEQEQTDDLQQEKKENRRLRKALQDEQDKNQGLRDENQELRNALQAAKDKYATLQEKFQDLRDEHRQRGTERDTEQTASASDRAPETDTTDPQTEASDRSNSSPVATAATKLRGGVTTSAGTVKKAAAKVRGRLLGAPDKPYPAQHATNIHTTGTADPSESEASTNSQSSRDEKLVESLQTERSPTDNTSDRERTNGQDGPDRGRF